MCIANSKILKKENKNREHRTVSSIKKRDPKSESVLEPIPVLSSLTKSRYFCLSRAALSVSDLISACYSNFQRKLYKYLTRVVTLNIKTSSKDCFSSLFSGTFCLVPSPAVDCTLSTTAESPQDFWRWQHSELYWESEAYVVKRNSVMCVCQELGVSLWLSWCDVSVSLVLSRPPSGR